MRHSIGYMGRFERNFARLTTSRADYLREDGSARAVHERPSKTDGIFFGYMECEGRRFVAVRAEHVGVDVVVASPVQLRPERHTDGKMFGPRPTTFGDESARRLLEDLIIANPDQTAVLRPMLERLR